MIPLECALLEVEKAVMQLHAESTELLLKARLENERLRRALAKYESATPSVLSSETSTQATRCDGHCDRTGERILQTGNGNQARFTDGYGQPKELRDIL